jgi:hypothetical protein
MTGGNLQFSTDVKLPSLVRRQVLEQMERLLEKHSFWFGATQLDVRIRNNGPQIECSMNLSTDDGRYHAHATGWDVRQIVHETLNRLDLQMHKRFEKRAQAWM